HGCRCAGRAGDSAAAGNRGEAASAGHERCRIDHRRDCDRRTAAAASAQAHRATRQHGRRTHRRHGEQFLRRYLHRVLDGEFRNGWQGWAARDQDAAESAHHPVFRSDGGGDRRGYHQRAGGSGNHDGHRRSPRRSPAARPAPAAPEKVQPSRCNAEGNQVGECIMSNDATLRTRLEHTLKPFADARTLPGSVYTSPEVFRLEQSGIFAHQWMCAGRESDIPSAGDYFLKDIAGNSIIFMRGRDGQIRAFYNVCRHRGSKLLETPCGTGLARVLCPYHAWSYNTDGTLQSAPQMSEDFRKDGFSLVPVRLELFHGFLFANLDDHAVPLATHFVDLPDLTRFR